MDVATSMIGEIRLLQALFAKASYHCTT